MRRHAGVSKLCQDTTEQQISATQVTPTIRAFEDRFDESDLTELRRRIEAARWRERDGRR
jgi:hypothetical protein